MIGNPSCRLKVAPTICPHTYVATLRPREPVVTIELRRSQGNTLEREGGRVGEAGQQRRG